jgi:hypothetical protein
MSHTPAPWTFGVSEYDAENYREVVIPKPFDYTGPGYYGNPYIYGPNGDVVAGCDEYHVLGTPDDARLIAAAPDLLEALSACRGQWIHSVNAERCLAAIEKATGKAQPPSTAHREAAGAS